MRKCKLFGRIYKNISENRPIYGQDSFYQFDSKEELYSPESRRRYTEQCAADNRITSLLFSWLALSTSAIMMFLFIIQPYCSKKTPFHPQYGYLYAAAILFSSLYIVLLHFIKDKPLLMFKIELTQIAALSIWSAVFSAVDAINGHSSYLFIQITIIQALMHRGGSYRRCLINLVSFVLYITILLNGRLDVYSFFSEFINPFYMSVISCAIILLNDRMQFKSFRNRELIREQNERLQYYADNDFLTGIPNRKSIVEYLDRVIASGRGKVACMMLDIDNFKMYNDVCGHIMGDDCLKRLAVIMQKVVVSRGGQLGRYGGEEFLAVFENMDEAECRLAAQEVVDKIEKERITFELNHDHGMVTISIGVAAGDADGMDSRDLIRIADRAMYKAKSEGKNRVCTCV